MERRRRQTLLTIVAILSTAGIAFLAYSPILDYFFTGTDTLTLIETSRIQSVQDVHRLFTQPLMAGTRFVDVAKFYRPLASLSYSLDYSLWKLEPFGFQLTNLVLHIVVSILVFFLLRVLCAGDTTVAWIGALVFATHPILVESVPAIDRRHDMLAVMFLIASLLAFVRYRRPTGPRTLFLVLSITTYVLGLGAKETAIVLPVVVFLHYLVFPEESSHLRRITAAAKGVAGYLAATLAYVVWRFYVLGGLGGYQQAASLDVRQVLPYLANIIHSYFQDLLYPADFLGVMEAQAGYTLTAVMISAFAGYLLVFAWQAGQKGAGENGSLQRKLLLFLAGWLPLPLMLFEATLTFAHRSMYLSVIPFSGILAITIVGNVRSLGEALKNEPSGSRCRHASVLGARLIVMVVGVALAASLMAHSPLLRQYKGWEDSADISSLVLKKLVASVPELPRNCAIHLYDLPDGIQSYQSKIPHSKDVAFLQDYSIKSWLNLNIPNNALKVIIQSRSWPRKFSGTLNLTVRVLGHDSAWALVTLGETRYSRLRRTVYYYR